MPSAVHLLGILFATSVGVAQVPPVLHHQGRMAVGEALFEGEGRFKFAFVNADASQVYWRNAPDADADGAPDAAVAIPVSRGLYSVLLGDPAVAGMAPLPSSVFEQPAVFLRVWFDDGVNGFERLSPDQRLGSVGYAMVAATVPDGSLTSSKLAPGTLDGLSGQIAILTAELNALSNRHESLVGSLNAGVPPGVPLVSPNAADPALSSQGFSVFMSVPGPGWTAGSAAGAPLGRQGHVGVWTGQSLLVWGGALAGGGLSRSGAGYDAALNRWSPIADLDAPTARRGHTAVWTGQAMLVWGGQGGGYLGTGGAFAPENPLWASLPTLDAPGPREGHVAVWTGARMLVWGGRDGTGLLANGGLYDPAGRAWSGLPLTGAPAARVGGAAVWTGAHFIVWGGVGESGELGGGGLLPLTGGATPGIWAPMTSAGAPAGRSGHSAVWTGQRLLFWGGQAGDTPLGDGASYDPVANSWQVISTAGAPAPRSGHVAVWTGQEMLVFGGETAGGTVATGGAFNPATGKWRPLSTLGGPLARSEAVGAWTGSELLVFGGRANGTPLAALQRLNPQSDWYFYRKP